MREYLKSRIVQVGLAIAALGVAPLAITMLVAALGFTADPNPNPVYFGMLAYFTFWPGLLIALVGAILHHRRHRAGQDGSRNE